VLLAKCPNSSRDKAKTLKDHDHPEMIQAEDCGRAIVYPDVVVTKLIQMRRGKFESVEKLCLFPEQVFEARLGEAAFRHTEAG
jgi:hypothetical protein